MKKTIIDLFEDSVGKYGGKTFLLEKRHHRFEPTTYAETRELALEVGAGLAALGIRPGDKVAILAEGSNAWIISELGLFYAGAVSVPLSVKLEESNDLLFRLRHAEVKALFVSKHQLPKIRRIRAELPQIELVVVFGHIALEAGETGLVYHCPGWCEVDGQIFRCAGGAAHGEVDLAAALEKSCNGYFIRLGQTLGAERVRTLAEQLGFGQAVELTDSFRTAAGKLPELAALTSSGAYANFCFGQGELLATPVQIAGMLNALVTGMYREPLFLRNTLDETTGEPLTPLAHRRAERVVSEETASALRMLLAGVVENGTGHEAALPETTAAGKTGTAQTGQFRDGVELKNNWFAGVFPAEKPQYTIVVLQDAQTVPAHSSAAIFAALAEMLENFGA